MPSLYYNSSCQSIIRRFPWIFDPASQPTSEPFQTGTKPVQQQERNKNIVALEETIKGKENLPAEQVFKNIELFKGMPASRVFRVMEFAFTSGLGVGCEHCHVEGKWESDEKKQKGIVRKMWALQRDTAQQVRRIVGKDDAAVNCTTCHRGDTKPALNLSPRRQTGN